MNILYKMKLSKSKIAKYENCPYKFKLKYVDNIKEPETPYTIYAEEGQNFHKGVVEYFNKFNPFKQQINMKDVKNIMQTKDEYVENFIFKFVKPVLLKNCNNNPKYYFPVLQEKKIENTTYDFNGVVDSVFISPEEDYIVVDWKTGKLKQEEEMREELICYKFLVDESGLLDKKIKYGAMFFVKEGKMFFDDISEGEVGRFIEKIKETRQKIENKEFEKSKNGCRWCGYMFGGQCKYVWA